MEVNEKLNPLDLASNCKIQNILKWILTLNFIMRNGKAGSRWEPLLGKRTLGALYLRSPGCGSRLPPATREPTAYTTTISRLVHTWFALAIHSGRKSRHSRDTPRASSNTRIRPTSVVIIWTMRVTITFAIKIEDRRDHYRCYRDINPHSRCL